MKKVIEICSINFRVFLEEVVKYANQGGVIPADAPAFKSPTFRCKMELAETVIVDKTPVVRVLPQEVKKEEEKASFTTSVVEDKKEGEKYSKHELEEMTLKELKEKTGIKNGSKKEIIEEYLSQEPVEEKQEDKEEYKASE